MKKLTLIRHAKSDWDHPSLSDHERPLNKRGKRAAPAVGRELARREVKPDLILSSTAVRALTTAQAIAAEIGYPVERIVQEEAVYLASVAELERVVAAIDDSGGLGHVMVFGHTPGMEDVLAHLSGGYADQRFITCAVAELDLDIDHWGEVTAGCGSLRSFFTPHDLA